MFGTWGFANSIRAFVYEGRTVYLDHFWKTVTKISASNGVEGMRLKGVYHGGYGVDGVSIFGIALDGGTRDFALVGQLYGCLSSSVLDAMLGASLIGRSLPLVTVLSIARVYGTYFSGFPRASPSCCVGYRVLHLDLDKRQFGVSVARQTTRYGLRSQAHLWSIIPPPRSSRTSLPSFIRCRTSPCIPCLAAVRS